jgi:hypothetical protein
MSSKKEVQKNWLRAGMAAVALAVLSMAVVADAGYTGPSWRGDPNTTVQQWSFGDSGTSPSPDTGFPPNPYGTPQTWIVNNAVYSGSIDSHSGVWQLGTGEIDIFIPNNPAAQFQKDIWVELVWKGIDSTFRPEQTMLGFYPDGSYTQLNTTREDTSVGSGWTSSVFKISVWPNPPSEWITIGGDIYVDQVVIDTRCIPEPIPEPATFGLLIGVAFMAIRRGRKIKD